MALGKVSRSLVMAVLLVGVSIVGSSCAQKQAPISEEKPIGEEKPKVEAQKEVPPPPPSMEQQPQGGEVAPQPMPEEGKGVKKHRAHKRTTHAKNAKGSKSHDEGEVSGATIYATLKNRGQFSTFLKAIKTAGLSKMLKSKGPFTILAPTDKAANIEALKGKNGARLQDVVNSHILKGKLRSDELDNLKSVQTWNGHTLRVHKVKGVLHIGKAGIRREDIVCANGVIQVVDAVIVPGGKEDEHKPAEAKHTKKKK
jgi:uncharacterized surface protein with fasciclin (FAS1) repeats